MNKSKYNIISFYKFTRITNLKGVKSKIISLCVDIDVKGIILISKEGINLTISINENNTDCFLQYLYKMFNANYNEIKISQDSQHVYRRLKIKIKKEILTIRNKRANSLNSKGIYLNNVEWDKMISDPNALVIDTRNDYEVSLGSFPNSIDPKTKTFSDIIAWANKNLIPLYKKNPNHKIAMYCTGGIRCEKATAYVKSLGFKNVYHLKGGILKYLENSENNNKWKGECFVFDNRVSLNSKLKKGSYDVCHACRLPLSKDDLHNIHYKKGISCQKCYDFKTDKQLNRYKERQKQIEIAKKKNIEHIKND